MDRPHRDTIFLEDARVLGLEAFPAHQYQLRLEAPRCAARATPGTFIHLQCATGIAMRRPLSIQRADPAAGWIEILFKVVGTGLRSLTQVLPGQTLSLLGPIGQGFRPDPPRPLALLVGGGVGMPPLEFLAERLQADDRHAWQPLAFFGSEAPFPFKAAHAGTPLHGLDHRINACHPVLERLGVPSRLASLADFDGCYRGYVTDLAGEWLAAQHSETREQVALYACGPQPMLQAAARLARDFGLPAQLCLEEYMACAVGGCAGCAVEVTTSSGSTMQRVCVDGPVFEARSIYPALFAAG